LCFSNDVIIFSRTANENTGKEESGVSAVDLADYAGHAR
jgi:hypothetical protein